MAWGCEKLLREHAEMIDSKVDAKIASIQQHVSKVDADLHVHKLEYQEHRRITDAWSVAMTSSQQKSEVSQENTEKNVQCIKDILETYLPNLKDAEEKRATKHQLKEGALFVSAVLGSVITIGTAILFIAAYFNGYFK